jgi:hypothetical protein
MPGEARSAATTLSRFALWRAALAAWVMPPGFALWTYGVGDDDGYDEPVVAKEPK